MDSTGLRPRFCVLSEYAEFLYKTIDYTPSAERCIRWDDPELNIDWQLGYPPCLLADSERQNLKDVDLFP